MKSTRGSKKGFLDIKQAEQLIKITTVILRDKTPMSYHDASLALAYCWRHTETEEMADQRLKKKVS